jgi:hypothetical protein
MALQLGQQFFNDIVISKRVAWAAGLAHHAFSGFTKSCGASSTGSVFVCLVI